MTYDFIIVGGGISGAVLANLLGRQGRRAVVLEREAGPVNRVRPEVLWPATADVLRSLLPKEWEADWGLPLRGIRAFERGRMLLDLDAEVFRQAGIQPLSTDPDRSRELLLRQAQAEVRRGVEVLSLLKEGARVVGVRCRNVADDREEDLRARWTVGDDGGRSLVRQQCGIELPARPFALKIFTFAFRWPNSLPAATVHVWLNPRQRKTGIVALGCIPLPRDEGVGLIPVRPWALDDHQRFDESLRALAGSEPAIAMVLADRQSAEKLNLVYPHWGHAEKYGVPGAVLLGDAAHPVTPAGGQGANMAVADAVALAELASESGDGLLERYEKRRRPANERSVSISRRATRALSLPAWTVDWLLPGAVRWVNRSPHRFVRFARHFATAFEDQGS